MKRHYIIYRIRRNKTKAVIGAVYLDDSLPLPFKPNKLPMITTHYPGNLETNTTNYNITPYTATSWQRY